MKTEIRLVRLLSPLVRSNVIGLCIAIEIGEDLLFCANETVCSRYNCLWPCNHSSSISHTGIPLS